MNKSALSHLEDAETALMSFMSRISETPEDAPEEDIVDMMPVVLAVLRSVSRAAGMLEAGNDALPS